LLQTLFDGTAAYSIFLTAVFLASGPEFTGRNFIVFALNFLATYFAVCVVFDIGTIIAVLVTAIKLQASPEAYYQGEWVTSCGDTRIASTLSFS
jgi:hypothetical protein